jgi:large subunit ribosomal protein L2
MGKNLTQQKRGKGTPTYTVPSFRFKGKTQNHNKGAAKVLDIVNDQGHSAPLLEVEYEDKTKGLIVAPEGIKVNDILVQGEKADIKTGNSLFLKDIPEGIQIFNIELKPGDGGKFVKASGMTARIVSKSKSKITIQLPSKKQKEFHPDCKATIGIVAGSGRPEKPYLKAGIKFKVMKARNKYWPSVSGTSMNSVDHPFGGSKSSHKGRPKNAPKNAPPGRKVGSIRPRQTGRNKGKRK